ARPRPRPPAPPRTARAAPASQPPRTSPPGSGPAPVETSGRAGRPRARVRGRSGPGEPSRGAARHPEPADRRGSARRGARGAAASGRRRAPPTGWVTGVLATSRTSGRTAWGPTRIGRGSRTGPSGAGGALLIHQRGAARLDFEVRVPEALVDPELERVPGLL